MRDALASQVIAPKGGLQNVTLSYENVGFLYAMRFDRLCVLRFCLRHLFRFLNTSHGIGNAHSEPTVFSPTFRTGNHLTQTWDALASEIRKNYGKSYEERLNVKRFAWLSLADEPGIFKKITCKKKRLRLNSL